MSATWTYLHVEAKSRSPLISYLLPDYVRVHISNPSYLLLLIRIFQPHNTRWLSPAQRRLAQVRLAEDAGEADEDVASDSYV